jgi:hypothetical protein
MARASIHKRPSRWTGAILAGFGAIAAATGIAVGCVAPPPDTLGTPPGAGATSGGNPQDAGTQTEGKQLFLAMEPQFMQSCGACHDLGGIADTPFLAGPDRYQSISSWPGFVTRDPTQSRLLTYPVSGKSHTGTNLDSPALKDTLLPKVKAWLTEEASTISAPVSETGPYIEPFVPIMGFNAIYLGPLGADFEGMAVTFSAETLTDTTLELSDIQVHPTSKLGVHLVHPLFVVYPIGKAPDPDPVDSFSNVDIVFPPGESATLSPGTVILTNWKPEAKLSLAFEKIEQIDPNANDGGVDDGGGPTGGCKNVQAFIDSAKGPLTVCTNCHGGANAQAKNAVDMSQLNSDTAAACAQIKNRVTPSDPPKSQLFVTTDPGGNAAHPFKFGGNGSQFNTFRDSVSKWIVTEQ